MKYLRIKAGNAQLQSPPARGAWIEISDGSGMLKYPVGRPPHGGRGLKYDPHARHSHDTTVAPRTGGVD